MSKRRQRREPDPTEFQDPLSDYGEREFSDEFERSLCADTIGAIGHTPYLSVDSGTTLRTALQLMDEFHTACVVVINEGRKPIGLLSEQDVVRRVSHRFEEVVDLPIDEVMTRDPVVVYESESPARALNLMGSGFFRHLPVCDASDRLIGVIGARRLTFYLQEHVVEDA